MTAKGTVIHEKYRLVRLLAEGGSSCVYLAVDVNLGKEWAIKEIKDDGEDQKALLHLRWEADLLKNLNHPGLVRVTDFWEEERRAWLVMDYVRGETLEEELKRKGRLSPEDAAATAEKIADILVYLHTREPPLCYRDLKPSNLIRTEEGGVVLVDFGIAGESGIHEGMGTIGYAAPEQIRGESCPQSDLYSLGAILYQMLTGRKPWLSQDEFYPARYWVPGLPAYLEDVIRRCLHKNPRERYGSARELKRELEAGRLKKRKGNPKRRVWGKRILPLAVLPVFCLAVACLGYLREKGKEDLYRELIWKVQCWDNQEEALAAAADAYCLFPERKKPLKLALEAIKRDGVFSQEEEAFLLRFWDREQETFKRHNAEGYMAYEMGVLYWFYSRSLLGERDGAKAGRAASWFKAAADSESLPAGYRGMAEALGETARLEAELRVWLLEEKGAGAAGRYFEALERLRHLAQEQRENLDEGVMEGIQTLYETACGLYYEEFLDSGVSKQRLDEGLAHVQEWGKGEDG